MYDECGAAMSKYLISFIDYRVQGGKSERGAHAVERAASYVHNRTQQARQLDGCSPNCTRAKAHALTGPLSFVTMKEH